MLSGPENDVHFTFNTDVPEVIVISDDDDDDDSSQAQAVPQNGNPSPTMNDKTTCRTDPKSPLLALDNNVGSKVPNDSGSSSDLSDGSILDSKVIKQERP